MSKVVVAWCMFCGVEPNTTDDDALRHHARQCETATEEERDHYRRLRRWPKKKEKR